MKTWLLILVLAVGTVLMKTIGPVLAGGRQPPAPVTRVIALTAPALISALIVAGTFTQGQQLVIDARAAGLAVGAVALWFRTPTAVALLLAPGRLTVGRANLLQLSTSPSGAPCLGCLVEVGDLLRRQCERQRAGVMFGLVRILRSWNRHDIRLLDEPAQRHLSRGLAVTITDRPQQCHNRS
jgi:branched-subunit amino acid transport protein